ncbi:MAG: post-transcriptional regulator [Aerococcus sp.]|nr:post-transcriptional regulator [Aerococcus sp.]
MTNKTMTLTRWQTVRLWRAFRKKAKAFEKAGYDNICWSDIKHYFESFKWKRKMPASIALMRQEIEALSVNQYFDYKQLEASALAVPKLEDMNWDELLK